MTDKTDAENDVDYFRAFDEIETLPTDRADMAAPKVRALEWKSISGCSMISGRCSLGSYTLLPLSDGTVRIYGIPGDSDHSATEPTIEAAKAAAQADFEAKVLACLE